jgi:hypothetical protein
MTPKDNELRMQIGLVVTHTDDELLFVRSEKNPNTLDALQAFAELVRQDEREACAKIALKYEPTERQPYVTYAADEIRARGEK